MALVEIKGFVTATMNETAEMHISHPSGAAGWKETISGTKHWNMTLDQKGRQSGPNPRRGDEGALQITELTEGDTPGAVFKGDCKCESVANAYDVDTGAPVGRTYVFQGHGEPGTDYTGGAGDNQFSSQMFKFEWDADPPP